jgi:hypothetical protein
MEPSDRQRVGGSIGTIRDGPKEWRVYQPQAGND